MTAALTIRPATPADAAALLALRAAVFSETDFMLWAPAEFQDTVADEAARIERLSQPRRGTLLVAEHGTQLVGLCTAMRPAPSRQRHTATLALGVRRSHWGQGVGRGLMQHVLAWADGEGLRRVDLTVHTTNLRALTLYLHFGFQVEGVRRQSLCVAGRFVDEYAMSRLSAAQAREPLN